jgi:hypothetical protein
MKTSWEGGCHCGAVRFWADLDPAAGTDKCNCTICMKMRLWSFKVKAADFTLLTDPAALRDYTYDSHVAHHYFCATCGIHAFDRVDWPSAAEAYYNVAVVCIDGLDVDALMAGPVTYQDGLHDRWDQPPEDLRLL